MCTVHSLDWSILWRRDDLFVGVGAKPVGNDMSHFMITSEIVNNTQRRETLHVFGSVINSSLEMKSEFRCENQGFHSTTVYLHIPGKQFRRLILMNIQYACVHASIKIIISSLQR